MVDKTKAFEVPEGILLTDENGNEGPFITGGASSPVGLNLPENTIYFQTTSTGHFIWKKVGNTNTDWRKYNAEDIPFDPSGSDELSTLNLQTSVQELANRNFGKNYSFNTAASFQTNSSNFVTALNFSGSLPSGFYRIQYGFTTTNTKANTVNIAQVIFDGNVVFERTQEGEASDNILSFEPELFFAGGNLNAQIQVRRSAGNGQARLSNLKGELWRVG